MLFVFPGLRTHLQWRDVLLISLDDIDVLRKACDHDSDAMNLARAAQGVHRGIFESKFSFHRSFQGRMPERSCTTITFDYGDYDSRGSKHQVSDSGYSH